MKIPNNKLSSVRNYFFEALSKLEESDIKSYFEYLCDAWLGLSQMDIQYIAGKSWFYGLEIGVK